MHTFKPEDGISNGKGIFKFANGERRASTEDHLLGKTQHKKCQSILEDQSTLGNNTHSNLVKGIKRTAGRGGSGSRGSPVTQSLCP